MSQPAISRLVFAGRGDRRPADAGARAARTRRRHARGIGVRRGRRRVQHHGRGRQAGPARRLRGRPRHRAVGRPGARGPGRRRHQAAPHARPGPGHRIRRRAGRGERRADVRHHAGRRVAARARRLGPGPAPARGRGSTSRATAWSRPVPARSSAPGRPACRPGSCCSPIPARWSRTSPRPCSTPVLARCDWWSCNRREAALLTGSDDPAEAARRLVRTDRGRADVIVRSGPGRLRAGHAGARPGDRAQPVAEPRRGARRDRGRHHRRGRRPLRGVPGRPGRRADDRRSRPPRQRGRRPGRHQGRGRPPRPPGPSSTASSPSSRLSRSRSRARAGGAGSRRGLGL